MKKRIFFNNAHKTQLKTRENEKKKTIELSIKYRTNTIEEWPLHLFKQIAIQLSYYYYYYYSQKLHCCNYVMNKLMTCTKKATINSFQRISDMEEL